MRNQAHLLGSLLTILGMTLGLAACEMDPRDEVGTDSYGISGTGSCPQWGCGANTATVNQVALGEFNLDGQQGDSGFRFVMFQNALGLPMSLAVQNGQFVATGLLGTRYQGSQLIGSRLIFENLSNLSLHVVVILGFGYVDSWTQPVTQVPAYHLVSATIGVDLSSGLFNEVCGAPVSIAGLTPLAAHYAVLVAGERYDADTKEVVASGSQAARWVNIACNRSALAKMTLLGYHPQRNPATTTAQRQATIKMLTAAYCDGTSFTQNGEPLRWHNRTGTAVPAAGAPGEASLEAIWSENGVLCLDTPRLAEEYPGIVEEIEEVCGALPLCSDLSGNWQSHGEWRTSNPVSL